MKNEINLDLFMSVVLFCGFKLNFQLVKKYQYKNLAIMGMIYMLFLFLCNILESYLLLGNEKLYV